MQVITMVGNVISLIVMWRSLSFPIVVNYQVTSQPHQPVLQITLLRIVLIQRAVDSYENLLSQIFCGIGTRSKSVGKVVDASGVTLNYLLPSGSIARATSANEFGSLTDSQSLYSPHLSSPATVFAI